MHVFYFFCHHFFFYLFHFVNFYAGHKDSVTSLAFSTDGQLLASGGFDGIVQIWDTSSGELKCTLDGPGGGIEVYLLRF